MEDSIVQVKEVIEELCDDPTVPKNIRAKFAEIVSSLSQESGETSMKINKALHELDEITNDVNLQPYIRTQIWNILSMLEKSS